MHCLARRTVWTEGLLWDCSARWATANVLSMSIAAQPLETGKAPHADAGHHLSRMWIPRNAVRCRIISPAFFRISPFVCQTRCQTAPHCPYTLHVCVHRFTFSFLPPHVSLPSCCPFFLADLFPEATTHFEQHPLLRDRPAFFNRSFLIGNSTLTSLGTSAASLCLLPLH